MATKKRFFVSEFQSTPPARGATVWREREAAGL